MKRDLLLPLVQPAPCAVTLPLPAVQPCVMNLQSRGLQLPAACSPLQIPFSWPGKGNLVQAVAESGSCIDGEMFQELGAQL